MSGHSIETVKTDLLIIGSEGAGCMAAIAAEDEDLTVIMVTKGRWGKSGATVTGFADFAVDSKSLKDDFGFSEASSEDSPDQFMADIIKGGKYLNNQKLVRVMVEHAPHRFRLLREWGARFTRIFGASGHSYPRGVLLPGPSFMQVLKRRAMAVPNLVVQESTVALELIVEDGAVKGALVLNLESGKFVFVQAKAVILASGGGMGMFKHSTAPVELTGDGFAMAARAGATLTDMEFPMFFPGLVAWPPALKKIEVPYHISAGGIIGGHMYNSNGERFMKKWDPINYEHTTRDIVSVGIYNEILAGNTGKNGGVYVSLKHLPDDLIDEIVERDPFGSFKRYGFGKTFFDMQKYLPDFKKNSLEAVAACHFSNGGVLIDEDCGVTGIAGLFAAGEVTGGVHGGNRLSGTAYTEFLVFGRIAGEKACAYINASSFPGVETAGQAEEAAAPYFALLNSSKGLSPFQAKVRLQNLAWEKLGVIRTNERIREALAEVQDYMREMDSEMAVTSKSCVMNQEFLAAVEAKNIAQCIEMIATAALNRPESRAAHFVMENPTTDYENWTRNIKLQYSGDGIGVTIDPVDEHYVRRPKGTVPYGKTEGE